MRQKTMSRSSIRAQSTVLLMAALGLGCGGDSTGTGGGEGEASLTGKVNGASVIATAWTLTTSSNFIVRGETPSSSGQRHQFTFVLPKPPQPTTYTLGPFASSMAGHTGTFAHVTIGPTGSSVTYYTQPGFTGTLTVTSYDASKEELVGTFAFSAAPESGTHTPASVSVTEGKVRAARLP